jgi:mono/diheme cytochrome c family protein
MKSLLALVLASLITPFLSASAADLQNGKTLFAQRCAMCHGELGAGDGPLAATMPPDQKPRNLAVGGNKFATDDAKLAELLQKGGAGVGLSVLMPPQPDLKPNQIADLIAFVNSLKK